MRRAAWLLLAFAGAAGAAPTEGRQAPTVALFSELQDAPPFSADEMAERQKGVTGNDEASAADLALNNWKNCVIESLARWAPLRQGPGTLIDGAYGRCADIERAYRGHLMRITQGGRQVVDVSMARSMTRMLEDAWRTRLTAMALDQDLARLQQQPQAPQQPVAPPAPAAAPPQF
jgi:hypothetical protein